MNVQIPFLDQAIQLMNQGAYPEAIHLLEQIVASVPAEPVPRLQLAKAYLDWVQLQVKISIAEIEIEGLNDTGKELLLAAENELKILIDRHPNFPHVQSLMGIVHLVYNRYEEAIRCLRKALRKEPRVPEVIYNYGYALQNAERFDEAITQFSRLTALYPEHGMGWHMLGVSFLRIGKSEVALNAFQKAIKIIPDWYQPYGGAASALNDLGRISDAMMVLREGLSKHPENWDFIWAIASIALATGEWKTGWRYYACRRSTNRRLPFDDGYKIPLPSGRPIKIRFDQGLGDELFFLRFVPILIARGIEVEYTTQLKLYPLLQGRREFVELHVANSGETSDFDVLVGDLPYLTGMQSTAAIPPSIRLSLDTKKVELLAKQLREFGPPPYLGVTWQGGTAKKKGADAPRRVLFKEISPMMLGKLARSWPGTVVVLQRLPGAVALADFARALGRDYLDWSHINDDLADALAGLSLLDEYVGVSNTNMHLLAGIGKVARVLVPHPAEWRWMFEGNESPWFPGFHIYRQAQNRRWDDALASLSKDLNNLYGQRD